MRPSDAPDASQMPAMLRWAPLGLACGGDRAGASHVANDDAALALEPVERGGIGEVVAVAVRHVQADDLVLAVAAGEDRVVVLDRSHTSRQTN